MPEKDRTIHLNKHKKRHFFKSVRFKFVCWFFVVATVPLLIIGIIAYYYGRSLATKTIYEHLITANDSRKEHIKTFLNAKKGRTMDFSSDGLIRDLTKKIVNNIEPHQIGSNTKILNSHLLKNKVPLDDDIFETFIINLNGTVISSSNEKSIGTDVSTCDYFQEGKKRVYVSQIYQVPEIRAKSSQDSESSSSTNRNFMAVASPLRCQITHDLFGILVNKVDKYALEEILTNRNGLGETGEIYIVNKDKLMVTESRFIKDAVLTQKVDTIGVQMCISGKSGLGIYNDYRGILVVGVYTWLDEPGWALMTEIDVNEAFAPLKKIGMMLIIITIPILFIVIVISSIISRRMTKPIITISDTVKNITAGKLRKKIPVLTNDELGDISTELNKIVSEINESYEQLLQSERLASIGRMASGVAHEINNPLSVLSGRLQLLIEKCTDKILSQEYKKLMNLANKIEDTVDGLLYFSRQKDMTLTITDIHTVIEESLSLLENQMIAQGIKIVKRYGVSMPSVKISVNQIQQVIFNIILNAFNSMTDNDILTIYTGLSADGRNIQMSFKDTGYGIPAKDIDKVFEPFFSTKSPDKGTGLGLSISYGIIKNHNGTINVQSKEGHGTTFTISLPVA